MAKGLVAVVQVDRVSGADVLPWIPQLAALRIRVFAEFPYCYDGDLDYEKAYLQTYTKAKDAVLVLAREGERVVGNKGLDPWISNQKPGYRARRRTEH